MNKIIRIYSLSLCLLVIFIFSNCNHKASSNCYSLKIQLLLEDLLKKKRYFTAYESEIINLNHNIPTPPDSSRYFGYLITSNFNMPNKEFYLHWNKNLVPAYPDSIKLRPIKVLSEMDSFTFVVGVSILEVNADSTEMKVELGFGSGRSTDVNRIFKYSFDEKNCKWSVLDSTITYY